MSRSSAQVDLESEREAAQASDETLLGEGTRFEGLLVLPHAARLDGHVRGEVIAHGALRIGPRGVVEADLEAHHVWVEGRVRGDLSASTRIGLGPGARVEGDLTAPRLSIAEGAQVNGRCRCGPGATPELPGRATDPS